MANFFLAVFVLFILAFPIWGYFAKEALVIGKPEKSLSRALVDRTFASWGLLFFGLDVLVCIIAIAGLNQENPSQYIYSTTLWWAGILVYPLPFLVMGNVFAALIYAADYKPDARREGDDVFLFSCIATALVSVIAVAIVYLMWTFSWAISLGILPPG